ncbi:MAG: helix-turn-helix domain-containing protein [Acidobacteria bacterium]|nr:helix-turn-helix domain-containing protein [Acidobacteriota bacterium]
MPIVKKTTIREARWVHVFYRNPAVRTRAGKLVPGSVIFEVDGRRFEVHTVYGAAKTLGRSAVRVQKLLEDGKLRGYRIGRDWLVLDVDLRHFIREQGAKVRKRFAAFLGGPK